MTLTVNVILMDAGQALINSRFPLSRFYVLSPVSISNIVNGFNQGVDVFEAAQNIAKHVSIILRDAGTGLGAALNPTLLSRLSVLMKKGGLTSYSAISPVLTAVGSTGLVDIALTASHLDTLGVSAVSITGSGILPVDFFVDVVAINKNDAVRAGLTAIPNANAAASGGLPTVGVTIPNATAGTSAGLALRQNVDDATTAVNAHTDTAATGVTTAVNAHTDTAATGVTTAVNAHTDTAATGVTTAVNAHTDAAIAALPSPTDILDALLADHSSVGSVGDGLAVAAGLLQGNFFMDTVINDGNGQTSARLRLWRNGSGVTGATSGGSGEGEFATFQVTTTYSAPGKVSTHRVVRAVGP